MTVSELIDELTKQENAGCGNLKVYYDFGACEVKTVTVEDGRNENEPKYIHLDWC
jgi:dihydroorotate dehydrogenase